MGGYARARGRACWRGFARIAALTALLPLLGGCGLFGGLSSSRLGSPQSMTVTSPMFSVDNPMPKLYTCRGRKLSPPLSWSGAPASATKSFAIVLDDSLAPITPYVYWIVFDINPNTTYIAQDQLPPGAMQALNSKGTGRYDPPCPIGARHAYRFTVYALNVRLHLRRGAGLRKTWSAIARHVIAIGRLTVYANP